MEFREVDGYKVSDCGLVIGKRGQPLIPHDNGKGYMIVSVTINGKHTSKAVHRFVAEAWIPNPENLPEVNHKDCIRDNNDKDNLEWCTHGYNIEYSYTTNGRSAIGVNNARAILTEEDARKICEFLSQGLSSVQIRDKGFNYGAVRKIKRRAGWTHISKEYSW